MGEHGRDGGQQFANGFFRDANGRLRDYRGRFAKAGDDLGDSTGRGFLRKFGRVLSAGLRSISAMLRGAAPVAVMGSAFAALIPVVASAAGWLANVGTAAVAAAPTLVAFGAAGLIVTKSLGMIFGEGSKAREALSGLGAMMTKAGEAGSKAAAKGIKPLVAQLRKVAQPIVTAFMERIGRAANRVQREFLGWAKSADGVRTLRNILGPIGQAMEELAPHVSRVAISFARMLGRIMGVSMAVGKSGLAGALDWLADRMDRVNAGSVSDGLMRLRVAAAQVWRVISVVAGWIGKLVQAYRMYTTQFSLVADAVSVAAIAFGGPVGTIIGIASLIIRHFDHLKAAWERLRSAFQGGGGAGPIAQAFQHLRQAVSVVVPALMAAGKQIWAALVPHLKEIWSIIKNELIPAWAEFQAAIAPVVAWLIGVLTPVVKAVMDQIMSAIKSALWIIIGVFRIFTGLLTGDWRKVWQGVQNIAKGAMTLVGATIRNGLRLVWATIKGTLSALSPLWNNAKNIAVRAFRHMVSQLASIIRSGAARVRAGAQAVKRGVTGVFSGAGSWLVSAGRAIVQGLVNGINSMIGRVRSALSKLTSMIPSWKGPMRVDLKLLKPSGQALMKGLVSGIESAVPAVRKSLAGVTSDIPGYATPRGVAAAGRGGSTELVIRSGGSRLDDLLVEVLRRAVRDKGGNVQKVLGS
mgnify:CR=1 FL=1